MTETDSSMNKTTLFRWLRLATSGAIVGVAFVGTFGAPDPTVEAIGATIGGATTALLLKLFHFA